VVLLCAETIVTVPLHEEPMRTCQRLAVLLMTMAAFAVAPSVGRCAPQIAGDEADAAEKLALEADKKIRAKVGAQDPYYVAVFPFGNSEGQAPLDWCAPQKLVQVV